MITKKAAEKYKTLCAELKNDVKTRDVQVLFVTKYFDTETVRGLYENGVKCFGENRVQDFCKKQSSLAEYSDIQWHFIGHLQRNKVKHMPVPCMIHSVESPRLVKMLEKHGKINNVRYNVLLEVNTGGEEAKYGLRTDEKIHEMVQMINESGHVSGKGFMTMAPFTSDEDIIRNCFRKLKKIREKYSKYGYTELSMGMSNDFRIALEEGATILRIGSFFFKDNV